MVFIALEVWRLGCVFVPFAAFRWPYWKTLVLTLGRLARIGVSLICKPGILRCFPYLCRIFVALLKNLGSEAWKAKLDFH